MPQKSDEIGAAAPKTEPAKADAKPTEPVSALKIDLADMENRVEALSIPGGSYPGLAASSNGVYFAALAAQGPAELKYFDLASAKIDLVAAGVNSFRLSANGNILLLNVNGSWLVSDAALSPALRISFTSRCTEGSLLGRLSSISL